MRTKRKRGQKKTYTQLTLAQAVMVTKHLPKTKRLRKKKYWLFCCDCQRWFNRFDPNGGTWGTKKEGGNLCNPCLRIFWGVK